jgi:hypothetical protein
MPQCHYHQLFPQYQVPKRRVRSEKAQSFINAAKGPDTTRRTGPALISMDMKNYAVAAEGNWVSSAHLARRPVSICIRRTCEPRGVDNDEVAASVHSS